MQLLIFPHAVNLKTITEVVDQDNKAIELNIPNLLDEKNLFMVIPTERYDGIVGMDLLLDKLNCTIDLTQNLFTY